MDMDRRGVVGARCHEAKAGLAVVAKRAVPRGRSDHIAVGVVRHDLGVPDVGDLVGHVDNDLPARHRAAVVVHDDIGVEAAAP